MGHWTEPETIFFSGIAQAADVVSGYVTIAITSFNQDRLRIHAMNGLIVNRSARLVLGWYNHNIQDNVPLADIDVGANRNGNFTGSPYIEVYPCDRVIARFYNPIANDDVYANVTLSRWIP